MHRYEFRVCSRIAYSNRTWWRPPKRKLKVERASLGTWTARRKPPRKLESSTPAAQSDCEMFDHLVPF